MFTRKIKVCRKIPCKVLIFHWHAPKTIPSEEKLLCGACFSIIGKTRWGIGTVRCRPVTDTLRLCESCGIEAEKDLKANPPE